MVTCSILLCLQKMSSDDDNDELMKIMMDEDNSSDENNTAKAVHDEAGDPEWSDNGEDTVEEDSVQPNSSRNVR